LADPVQDGYRISAAHDNGSAEHQVIKEFSMVVCARSKSTVEEQRE